MPMTPRQMITYLKNHGFEVVSQNGSHVKLKSKYNDRQILGGYYE